SPYHHCALPLDSPVRISCRPLRGSIVTRVDLHTECQLESIGKDHKKQSLVISGGWLSMQPVAQNMKRRKLAMKRLRKFGQGLSGCVPPRKRRGRVNRGG